jgi:GH15 family glucan-1,4-alpha-glucosidase
MAARIEDYALIGDTETAALVSRGGAIDWFCAPRFDSAACLAGLLGTDDHGSWVVAPVEEPIRVERHYRGNSLVLETVYTTASGEVAVIDFMPVRGMVVPMLPQLPDVLVAEDAGEGCTPCTRRRSCGWSRVGRARSPCTCRGRSAWTTA